MGRPDLPFESSLIREWTMFNIIYKKYLELVLQNLILLSVETRYTKCYLCFLTKKNNTLFQKRNKYLYLPISV